VRPAYRVAVRDASSHTTTFGYYANGLPQTITQPPDPQNPVVTTTLVYFADGTVNTMTDPSCPSGRRA
jgi:YD repeat-containing protein